MQLIKIFILFILTIIGCTSLGIQINKLFKLNIKKYYFPIGFAVSLGIYELIMFIPLYTYASHIYSYIAVAITGIIIFISLIINFKDLYNNLINKKNITILLYLLFGIIILTFASSVLDERGDQYFYMGYIISNAKSWELNVVNNYGMGDLHLLIVYMQAGFYHLIAALSNIFRIDPYLTSIWYLPLLYILATSTSIYEAFYNISKKHSKISLIVIAIFLLNPLILQEAVIANIFKDSILFCLITILINKKKLSIQDGLLLAIISLAGISVHSTFLFYLIIIITVKGFYTLFHNKNVDDLTSIFIFAIPTIIFGLMNFISQIINPYYKLNIINLLIILIITALLIWLSCKYLSKFTYIAFKTLSIFIVILIYLISFLLIFKNQSLMNYMDFFKNIFDFKFNIYFFQSLNTIIYICLSIYYITKKDKHDFIAYIFLISYIIFFNPITISFISTYITSVVYFRITGLINSILLIIIVLDSIDNKKIQIFLSTCVIIGLCIHYTNIKKYIPNFNNYNPIYRVEQGYYDTIHALDLEANTFKEIHGFYPTCMITDFRTYYFSQKPAYLYSIEKWRGTYYYHVNDDSYDFYVDLYNLLSKGKYFKDDDLQRIQNIIDHLNIDYVVIDKLQPIKTYQTLENICEVSKDTGSHRLYKCNQR